MTAHNEQQPGSADLPPLPEPFGTMDIYAEDGRVTSRDGYTADQMRGAMLDAIAASRRAAPSLPDVAMPEQAGEVAAFEAWAMAARYDMTTHSLHWLFLNERTYAARQGWKAALEFMRKPRAAQPAEGSALVARTDEIWRNEVARLEHELVVSKRGNKMLLDQMDRMVIQHEQMVLPARSDTPAPGLYDAALLAVERMRGCAATYIEDHAKDTYPGAPGLRPQDVAMMWAQEIHRIDAKEYLNEAIVDLKVARIDGDKQGAQGDASPQELRNEIEMVKDALELCEPEEQAAFKLIVQQLNGGKHG